YTSQIVVAPADMQNVMLPLDLIRVISVTDLTNNRELQVTNIKAIDHLASYPSWPTSYSVAGGNMVIGPPAASDTEMRVRYICQEPRLVYDHDTPLIPLAYEDGVIFLAIHFCASSANDSDKATEAY